MASEPDNGTDGSRKTLLEQNIGVSFIVKRLGGKGWFDLIPLRIYSLHSVRLL
jgi:hypothetical protein